MADKDRGGAAAASPAREPRGPSASEPTRDRIIAAALRTLKEEGFAGASARAIARRGGFNQALIFYHFGTLADLLLAALDATSARRMERYQEALDRVTDVTARLRMAQELYREDLESGHITVVSEMIAGALGRPDLGPQVVARMEPWLDLVTDVLREAMADTPFAAMIPPRTAALLVVAAYLGVDMITHLDPDRALAEPLFEMAERLAGLLTGGGA